MLEVNAIYFILLVEGFGLLLFLILVWILLAIIRIRRKGKAVAALVAHRVTAPLRGLASAARTVGSGELGAQAPEQGGG